MVAPEIVILLVWVQIPVVTPKILLNNDMNKIFVRWEKEKTSPQYVVVNRHNQVILITRYLRLAQIHGHLAMLDTSKIPHTVYM